MADHKKFVPAGGAKPIAMDADKCTIGVYIPMYNGKDQFENLRRAFITSEMYKASIFGGEAYIVCIPEDMALPTLTAVCPAGTPIEEVQAELDKEHAQEQEANARVQPGINMADFLRGFDIPPTKH